MLEERWIVRLSVTERHKPTQTRSAQTSAVPDGSQSLIFNLSCISCNYKLTFIRLMVMPGDFQG